MRMITLILAVFVAPPALATSRTCSAVPGSSAVLRPDARVIFGEMHGNNETQQLIADVTCSASELGPTRVGLEIPKAEQPRIDAFLASDGTDSDRKRLTAGAFWTRKMQDGRSSVAMLALIESLRQMSRQHADVKAVAFDVDDGDVASDRDASMAKTLAAAFSAEPKAIFIVLVGNLHARKAPHPQFKQRFMAQWLVEMKQPVITLNAAYSLGSSWVCTPTCGPRVIGRGPPSPRRITVAATDGGAYDGSFSVGAPTFAAPAAVPPSADEKKHIELVGLNLDAQRALDDKQYSRCGDAHADLARRDSAQAAGHRYDAACCFALAGDRERAFKELDASVAAGYRDRPWLEKDADLRSLHGDARWPRLVSRLAAAPSAP